MAMLIQDDIFKCDNCGSLEFEIREIRSFKCVKNKDNTTSLLSNTERQVLVCNNCKKEISLDNELKIDRAV